MPLNFPTPPTSPWFDPNGQEWVYLTTKNRWEKKGQNLSAGSSIALATTASPDKATPVDADSLGIVDSTATSNPLRRLTFAGLKTWVQSVVDSLTTIANPKTFAGQVRLTGQTAAAPDFAMNRGLTAGESAYAPIPYGHTPTAGTANTTGSNMGNDFNLTLSGAVVGNFRVTSSLNALYNVGSGANLRMSDGRVTYMFDALFNGLVGNDVYFSHGVAGGLRLGDAVGWAVRWVNGGNVELQIHNGTSLQTLVVGNINSVILTSWVVVWELGTLSLYLRSHTGSNTLPGRYVLLGSLVGVNVPTSAANYNSTWVNECVVNGSFRGVTVVGSRFIRDAVHPNL